MPRLFNDVPLVLFLKQTPRVMRAVYSLAFLSLIFLGWFFGWYQQQQKACAQKKNSIKMLEGECAQLKKIIAEKQFLEKKNKKLLQALDEMSKDSFFTSDGLQLMFACAQQHGVVCTMVDQKPGEEEDDIVRTHYSLQFVAQVNSVLDFLQKIPELPSCLSITSVEMVRNDEGSIDLSLEVACTNVKEL